MSELGDAIIEMAEALQRAGALDKLTLRQIKARHAQPLPTLTAADVQRIREKSLMSQPVFADLLRVGASTVAQWEQGRKTPSGPAQLLLDLIDRKGVEVLS